MIERWHVGHPYTLQRPPHVSAELIFVGRLWGSQREYLVFDVAKEVHHWRAGTDWTVTSPVAANTATVRCWRTMSLDATGRTTHVLFYEP